MRTIITKRNSTKSERIFYELLKELRIPFKYKVHIDKYEIDFLIGCNAIEIDGHEQSSEKNARLYELGYNPVHYENIEFQDRERIKETLKQYVTNKNKERLKSHGKYRI